MTTTITPVEPDDAELAPEPDGTTSSLRPEAAASARRPVAAPAAAPIAVLLAVALLAAGAVLIRDALVSWNVLGGTSWTTPVLAHLDGLTAQPWMLYAGVALAVIGLVLVILAAKPRRRRGVSLGPSGAVWIQPRDLEVIARDAARDVSGVTGATVSASRKSIRLRITTTATDTEPVAATVTDVVTAALSELDPAPLVRVRARTAEVSS